MGLGILLFSTFVFLVFALYFATKLFGSQENQTDQIHDTTSGVFYYIGPFHHQNNHPNCIYVPNYPITHPPAYCTPLKGDQGGHSIKLEPSKSINSELPHISTVEVKVKEKACYPQRLEETSHVNKRHHKGIRGQSLLKTRQYHKDQDPFQARHQKKPKSQRPTVLA
ncbi:hypothetical protein DFH28DRAFT_60435 [Melampsora americana]|nr:hypothetical protein DFH28DRAFT_60435 [Melampsora americana]